MLNGIAKMCYSFLSTSTAMKIVNKNGMLDFQCQHGPAECYGNKLHACALDQLPHTTALLYNACLMNSLMRISVENGRTMALTRNIITVVFFCVTYFCDTWTHQADIESNNLNESDYEAKSLDINDIYLTVSKNSLRSPDKVRIQLYYECLCPDCTHFGIDEFAPVVETMSSHLYIQTYPFGNAQVINNDDKLEFKCQHGPAECHGNKLHACAIDKLQHTTALLFNICLMNSTDSKGSDDKSADRCGKLMNIDSEPIKECAKSTRGTELLRYYGAESKKANFSYVPYVLINGEVFRGDDFKTVVCNAFTNPPPSCE